MPDTIEKNGISPPSLGSVRAIIETAGGAGAIAEASGGAISAEAVYKWPKIGIPDRHWPFLMKLCPVTADQLLTANISARKPPNPR